MSKLTSKMKIIILSSIVIIISGIIVGLTTGIKYDLKLQETKRLVLGIEKQFEISDVREITNEVLGNREVVIQKIELYEDYISIITKDISEEEKINLVEKINEKYNTEIDAENVRIEEIPKVKFLDIIKNSIAPIAIATVVMLVYISIRFRKLGMIKMVVKSVVAIITAQAVLMGIIMITKIPVGRLTIPMILAIYITTIILIISKFEKELSRKEEI